jgi:hypothetical protein
MDLIIRNICELPIDFSRGNKSAFQLASESGFLITNEKLALGLIKEYLESHPNLIEKWSIWSVDKRTEIGYFLNFDDRFIVGYADYTKVGLIKAVEYETALDACSEFILLEICSILNVTEKSANIDLKWNK